MGELVRLHTFRQGISRFVEVPLEDVERTRQDLIAEGCLVWPTTDRQGKLASSQAA